MLGHCGALREYAIGSDSQLLSTHCLPFMTHSVQFIELFPKELRIWIRCVK